MATVVFDPAEWLALHPQFTDKFTDIQLQHLFELACLLLDNSNNSPVPYDPVQGVTARKTLLGMLVCHLAALALRPADQAGPVASASEGSVSVNFQLPDRLNGQWYQQTPCGQAYWQAIRKYLVGGRYYPACNFLPGESRA